MSTSLWLPVGRANFYSTTANSWLVLPPDPTGVVPARSRMLTDPAYVPRLQVSVLRRLLEVLPLSFGYEPEAACVMNQEVDDLLRPVAVTLTLRPKPADSLPEGPERWANEALARVGVSQVTLHVDEHGSYTFTAHAAAGRKDEVTEALLTHITKVFGGAYSLDRRSDHARAGGADVGGLALRRYNGIDGEAPAQGRPRGILTFFQLNVLVEGLFNQSLSPAVFFEHNDFLATFVEQTRRDLPGALSLIEEMRQVIGLLAVKDVDAGRPDGQVIVLRRFLDVTSREVLQRIKWSVESVRRSLLDESVTMLHRQTDLVQLDMSALDQERTPELAVGASESQLRGYVMLVAAKLPLVRNVYEFAALAKDHLEALAHGRDTTALTSRAAVGTSSALTRDVARLGIQLEHWQALLRGLRNNVRGLENAIEHAWRENLLYEQQQVRREQEAVAEIERSRAGRPVSERASKTVYNFLMLVFTAAAVLLTIKTGNILDINNPETDWWATAVSLWPIAAVAVVFYLVVPLFGTLRRVSRDRSGHSDSYPYEFTFRLQETADANRVRAFLSHTGRRRLTDSMLPRLTLNNRGGGRIERVSGDRALVKIHSIATFRVGFGRYARFEIVNEILAHRVSNQPRYAIVQCRLFGDSPKPLKPETVYELVGVVLHEMGVNLTTSDPTTGDKTGIEVAKVLELVGPLFADEAVRARIDNRSARTAGATMPA
ncbi:MAG: hypothetical protein IRY85_05055 [Micromonosporaceae bacterium]|nr:hypothetical protein [Micromonosporaceae bacterium]